jgi:hypothetical protein
LGIGADEEKGVRNLFLTTVRRCRNIASQKRFLTPFYGAAKNASGGGIRRQGLSTGLAEGPVASVARSD